MPPFNRHRSVFVSITVLLGAGIAAVGPSVRPAVAESSAPISIRSRQIELHYRTVGVATAEVELWYTRDRGISWQCFGRDEDHTSPLVFTAPGEGLYGLSLIAYVDGKPLRPAPTAYELPQRWVFIDATPPLAQWNAVEPAEDFATSRRLQLRWTAHDDNLGSRPVGLSYQSSIDQAWHTIDDAVANTGLYDWKVPENIGGQITLKLLVRDQGGQTVERPFGPIALSKIAAKAVSNEVQSSMNEPRALTRAESRPANGAISSTVPANVAGARGPRLTESPGLLPDLPATATRPAVVAKSRVDLVKQRMATDLYRQGSWHLVRGQYGVAAERLRESLEQDPDLLEAHHDLAGIFYRQQDYDHAISEYQAVLSRNANYEPALYGAALAYVAKRDYSQSREMLTRLLTVNDRNAEAWLDLGDVLFMMGDVINARANWRRAVKVDPSAQEVVTKAQRRLEQYGANDEVARK